MFKRRGGMVRGQEEACLPLECEQMIVLNLLWARWKCLYWEERWLLVSHLRVCNSYGVGTVKTNPEVVSAQRAAA